MRENGEMKQCKNRRDENGMLRPLFATKISKMNAH